MKTDDVLITCDGLVKIFKTEDIEVMALQGLDMEIKRGELMSVIGKSGSGKSTLMNIIGGLEKPSAGKIVVAGKNLSDMTEKEMVNYRKNTVGFVWQKSERNLFKYLTALENIEAAMNFTGKSSKEKRTKALELLEMVGMSHKKDSYPTRMSGGEQQRIAIAVALANDPQILLADEPTGAVDTKTSNHIQDLFRRLNKELGITIIIVTHDMKLAAKVDRVVMISDGKISTEKIMKAKYRENIDSLTDEELYENAHEEYSVLDKAGRVQLNDEMLDAAGIDTNKVKITVEDGKVIITAENS
ncbi:MAG: ABC transporter ATP-binding protein [Lachnospiraceae bacterium]|nr:ABC transporter ATP-binding protein [Lachnospiraceae bacterium]